MLSKALRILILGLAGVALLFILLRYKQEASKKENIQISSLRLIGEQIIADSLTFGGVPVGGFSGIDYTGEKWILICDDTRAPIRFYEATLKYDTKSFQKAEIAAMIEITDSMGESYLENTIDPEAIRHNATKGTYIWTSEGNIAKGITPFVQEISPSGQFVKHFAPPSLFQADSTRIQGPRHNGTFEGLTSLGQATTYWVAMELPLIQDGEEPIFEKEQNAPIRVLSIDTETGVWGKQFAYHLGKVARKGEIEINGVSEILAYAPNQFLFVERSYSSGYSDGGNNVYLYQVDTRKATDISPYQSLKNQPYTPASKRLLFDFDSIRDMVQIDNIEGIAWGPDLENGNKSLVVVADNNFNAFGPQLNQFLVFEVIP